MMTNRFRFLFALMFCVSGCGTPPPAVKYRIAVVPKGTTHEFWRSIHAGAVAAAREHGSTRILWEGPAKEDQRHEQQQIVERFASEGVDAIVLAPCDRQTMVKPVEAALAKGVPFVIFDSGIEPKPSIVDSRNYLGYIATDNHQGGVEAAKTMISLLQSNPKSKVMLLRYARGSESTEQREAGFRSTITANPAITLIEEKDEAGATVDSAQRVAERLLADHKDLDGIFAPNESSVTGVLRALELLKSEGKTKLVGFDASELLVRALAAGKVHGLVLQDPFDMGYQSVKRALSHLENKQATNRDTLHTGLKVATLANMNDPAIKILFARDLKPYLTGE